MRNGIWRGGFRGGPFLGEVLYFLGSRFWGFGGLFGEITRKCYKYNISIYTIKIKKDKKRGFLGKETRDFFLMISNI